MAIKGNFPLSTKNSTDTPLAAGATFTGGADAVSLTENIQSVTVTVYADTASSFEGLQMQFSPDGTNWDHKEGFTVEPNKSQTFEHNMEHRYFRVVYHTLDAQSVFRLQTRYNTRRVGHYGTARAEAVRISNSDGTDFVDTDRAQQIAQCTLAALEALLVEQRITNLHLSQISGNIFTEEDTIK
jgi:hypothetical protein